MIIIRYLIFSIIFIEGFIISLLPCYAQTSFSPQPNTVQVDVKKSFSDNLTDGPGSVPTKALPSFRKKDDRETWLESLISKGTSELFNMQDAKTQKAEKKRIEKVLQKKRSNAAHFDISGIRLRMSPNEVERILLSNGYRRQIQEERIPNFIKWRSEELCRIHGIIGFERIAACTKNVAKTNGFNYVAREVYNRDSTHENIEILYTSTFTDNLAHRIYYKSHIPFSNSKASQNIYINNIKIYDFWKRIDERYAQPENTREIKWGLGGKKPYLKATTGSLELVDPLLKDLDSSRMLNEDSRLANTPYYTF